MFLMLYSIKWPNFIAWLPLLYGGGLLFYINENIPSEVVNDEDIPNDTELILFDFLVKTQKCLCVGIYKPPF